MNTKKELYEKNVSNIYVSAKLTFLNINIKKKNNIWGRIKRTTTDKKV